MLDSGSGPGMTSKAKSGVGVGRGCGLGIRKQSKASLWTLDFGLHPTSPMSFKSKAHKSMPDTRLWFGIAHHPELVEGD